MRVSYKLWEEPKAPDFVLEITSRSTRAEDQGRKREVYASLGVREYWLFDPTGTGSLRPFRGFAYTAANTGRCPPSPWSTAGSACAAKRSGSTCGRTKTADCGSTTRRAEKTFRPTRRCANG